MTFLVDAVTALPVWATYAVVIALVFGEAAVFVGVVFPGETALLLAGALASAGRLSLPVLAVLAVVAAVVGDSVGYEVGRRFGPALRHSRAGQLVGDRRWARAEAAMARRGGWAVLAGRWVGVLRALMPAIAGSTRMPYRRFLLFNAVGGTLWAAVVVVAGYLAGASWHRVETYLGSAGGAAAALAVVAFAAFWTWRWWARRRADRAPAPPTVERPAGLSPP